MRLHQAIKLISPCLIWAASSASAQDAGAAATAAPAPATTVVADAGARDWTIGPYFSGSIMHPMTFGVDGRWTKDWAASLSYGKFAYSPSGNSKVQDLTVTITHVEAVGSWFPWQGVFRVDGGLGRQSIDVAATSAQEVKSSSSTGDKLNLDADFSIVSTYLYAGCGWLWNLGAGFNIGTGLGLQLPISSKSNFNAKVEDSPILDEALKATAAYNDLRKAAKDAGKTAGMLALPRIELLRLGWLF